MKILKLALFPVAFLYGLVMRFRNFLYDTGFFKSRRFNLPVISVGNLTVGGTGKTPHVEYLLNLLQGYKTATLSRGYKRKTSGFRLAGQHDSAATIGDEPFQYYLDFPDTAVAVCEKRVTGIENIRRYKPGTEVIILDDAYQHRPVVPKLNFLITDFYRRFDLDFMLPTGLLREPRSGARRADAVIVSKCPDNLAVPERASIREGITRYLKPGTPVFFTRYVYEAPVGFGSTAAVNKNLVLVTGIANAEPLIQYLKTNGYSIAAHLRYPDHYSYTLKDLQEINNALNAHPSGNISILTTRKDAVKLADPAFKDFISGWPVFYIPVKVSFIEGKNLFDEMVLAAVPQDVKVN